MSLLSVRDIGIEFGGVTALQGVSLSVRPKEIFAIIGPNGAGKTTLFNVISGLYAPTRGKVELHGNDVTRFPVHRLSALGLSRTFQNLQIFFRMTAAENVMVGRHLHEQRGVLSHLFALPSVKRQNAATRVKAEELLAFVGMKGISDQISGNLPYGALKRLEIARALAAEPKILLLDEPAAGCNATETAEIDDIIQKIASRGIAVVLVEHDMRLVMKISHRIHVLESGKTLAEGTAQEVRANPKVIAAYLGKAAGEEAAHA
jgi:branched-chain amino acid transport system ATP-binding protein